MALRRLHIPIHAVVSCSHRLMRLALGTLRKHARCFKQFTTFANYRRYLNVCLGALQFWHHAGRIKACSVPTCLQLSECYTTLHDVYASNHDYVNTQRIGMYIHHQQQLATIGFTPMYYLILQKLEAATASIVGSPLRQCKLKYQVGCRRGTNANAF